MTIYQPTTNTFAVPQCPLPSSTFSGTNFANLIRRSVNETTNGEGETNASTHSTATASRNGRGVGPGRWNAPFLLFGAGFNNTNQLPNWIYVNADGSATNTPTTNAVGRFAYNVYDVSGLLDINVAGYPSPGISGTNLSILKGTLAGADLSVIPGITSAFVPWRNTKTAATASDYVNAVTNSSAAGFLRAQSGDNRLTSRHDLIKLARAGAYGITTDALPYLTHFSRAANAPSWTPRQNASDMTNYVAALKTTGTWDYRANADTAASVNRNTPNVRVKTLFTRRDGTTAQVGEPLIKQRFPLSKMALVQDGATDPDILKYFGLTWNATLNGWDYRSTTINTLDQVATAGREPDFFELLKAGMLDGSLGKSSRTDTGIQNFSPDGNKDLQILTVGANLIDQADADDEPTCILRPTASETIFGIENHPYIYMISQTHFRRRDMNYDASNTANPEPWVTAYQQFQVWNPHLNATTHPGRTYRIRAVQGVSRVRIVDSFSNTILMSLPVDQKNRFISFNGSVATSEPVLLRETNTAADTSAENKIQSIRGFHLGDVRADNNLDGDNKSGNDYKGDTAIMSTDVAINYLLEYSDGGTWYPVQRIYPINSTMGWYMENVVNGWVGDDPLWGPTANIYSSDPAVNVPLSLEWCKSDPRSQRFGMYGAGGNLENITMRQDPLAQYTAWDGYSSGMWTDGTGTPWPTGWVVKYPLPLASDQSYAAGWGYTPGELADNRTTGAVYIADPDGVVRPADGTRATNILGVGSQARPVMLNRPLTSVGEMAYAMRGGPWKSLDFCSASSADSALLDLFCVGPATETQAGVVNPNRAPPEVLQALLLGAGTDPVIASGSLTPANATSIASATRNYLATNVIENRADLVSMSDGLVAVAGLDYKRQKEVIVRTFADVSNTRTWNLLVDVVAQIGSFPPTSTSADAFIVQGEQRAWTHLAVDRPTNKAIFQFSEPCLE